MSHLCLKVPRSLVGQRPLSGPFRAALLTGKDPKGAGTSESPWAACGNAGSQAPQPEILKEGCWQAAF